MAILDAIADSVSGVFSDQWKDIITAGAFDELTVVAPGVPKPTNNGRGVNTQGSTNVLTNGTVIYVPENTAAIIFSQSGIEDVLCEPGGYTYNDGQESVFNGDSIMGSLVNQAIDRLAYGGVTPDEKRVSYINLREMRGIKFGTRGPVIYHDIMYGADLEVFSYGVFSVRVCDAERFARMFLPPNTERYTFASQQARTQLSSDFLQSFITALNSLSKSVRVAEIPSAATQLAQAVKDDGRCAGTWPERFGLEVVAVAVESVELSDASRELVHEFASNRMEVRAYEGISRDASDMAAQQSIAKGIEANGLGDGGGMVFGMNMAQGLDASARGASTSQGMQGAVAATSGQPAPPPASSSTSLDEQIAAVKNLKELLDAGILTQEEFDQKKREVLGLRQSDAPEQPDIAEQPEEPVRSTPAGPAPQMPDATLNSQDINSVQYSSGQSPNSSTD